MCSCIGNPPSKRRMRSLSMIFRPACIAMGCDVSVFRPHSLLCPSCAYQLQEKGTTSSVSPCRCTFCQTKLDLHVAQHDDAHPRLVNSLPAHNEISFQTLISWASLASTTCTSTLCHVLQHLHHMNLNFLSVQVQINGHSSPNNRVLGIGGMA